MRIGVPFNFKLLKISGRATILKIIWNNLAYPRARVDFLIFTLENKTKNGAYDKAVQ